MLFKQYFNTRYRPPIKLKGIGRLLFFHLRAFRLHYRLKRKFCKRVVRGIRRGENRLGSLTHQFEGRLDSVLYRLRWASSIREARQAVLGCRIYVNGRPRLSPSYVLRPGDKLVLVGGRSSLNRHIRKVWTWSH